MAKIDRVEDLPEWFDLETYRSCESFGAAEWVLNLNPRSSLLEFFDILERYHLRYLDELAIDSETSDWVPQLLDELRSEPVKRAKAEPLRPVRPMTFMDLADQIDTDSKKVSRAELWGTLSTGEYISSNEKYNALDVPVGSITTIVGSAYALLVDLRATDSVLIDAFSVWLKEMRASQPSGASKRERPAYKDWARYGLLPYLDLLIWAKETGNQIPHHVMAEAVGYRKGGDSFRKTVPKLAADLMWSLAELEALAAIEAGPEKLGG